MKTRIAALATIVVVTSGAARRQDASGAIVQGLDAKRQVYADIAKQIWSFAEVGYQEQKSSALLQSQLRAAGFDVRSGVAGIPTAFVASVASLRMD